MRKIRPGLWEYRGYRIEKQVKCWEIVARGNPKMVAGLSFFRLRDAVGYIHHGGLL